MQIDLNSSYKDFVRVEQCMTEESAKEIQANADKVFTPYNDLTLVQFLNCCNKEFSEVLGDTTEPTILQAYWIKGFNEFCEQFEAFMQQTRVPQTQEEQQASMVLPKQTMIEHLLVFGRSYFGLHSFREAEQLTLGDIKLAKRDAYISGLFQRKLQAIQMANVQKK